MKTIQHIIFVGQQPKIFRFKNKANNSDDFRFHYAVDIQIANRMINNIPKLYPKNCFIFVIIDVDFAELKKLLILINRQQERMCNEKKSILTKSFIFVPFVDLLNPTKTSRLLNQGLEWGKLKVRAIFSGAVDFNILNQVRKEAG